MDDVVAALWSAQNDTGALGRVIMGLGVLTTRYEELWMIREGHQPNRVKSKDIGITLGSLTIGGHILAPLCNIKGADRDSGEPCVYFEMVGQETVFVPATAPDDDRFIKELDRFLSNDWYDSDTIYLSDLDGAVGNRDNDDLVLHRPEALRAEHPDAKVLIPEDEIRIFGDTMRLADIVWFERESDGDGNRFGHIFMTDGRYRRISFGDLGR